MEVIHDEDMLVQYVNAAVDVTPERPILIDKFLENAMECEADALCDGTDAFVPAVMEHIEYAGVHSGDSACVIPPVSIPPQHLATIYEYTKKIAVELRVVGLMNMQYAILDDVVRAGSQPPSFAHRPAGLQGLQRADGRPGHQADARRQAWRLGAGT